MIIIAAVFIAGATCSGTPALYDERNLRSQYTSTASVVFMTEPLSAYANLERAKASANRRFRNRFGKDFDEKELGCLDALLSVTDKVVPVLGYGKNAVKAKFSYGSKRFMIDFPFETSVALVGIMEGSEYSLHEMGYEMLSEYLGSL